MTKGALAGVSAERLPDGLPGNYDEMLKTYRSVKTEFRKMQRLPELPGDEYKHRRFVIKPNTDDWILQTSVEPDTARQSLLSPVCHALIKTEGIIA
jgi:hypothetical protein